LPFITNTGDLIGFAFIDPKTFPPGTILSISSPNTQPSIKDRDDGCHDSDVERASPVVNIKAENAPNSRFDPPVQLQLGIYPNNTGIDRSSMCLGYSNNNKDPLKCQSNGPRITDVTYDHSSDGSNSTIVQADTPHFTSFAVLLGGTGFSNGCGSDWLWIVSVTMLASFILAVPVLILLIEKTRLRGWFYGYHSRTLKEVESALKKKQSKFKSKKNISNIAKA